jgi:hypothetical protein
MSSDPTKRGISAAPVSHVPTPAAIPALPAAIRHRKGALYQMGTIMHISNTYVIDKDMRLVIVMLSCADKSAAIKKDTQVTTTLNMAILILLACLFVIFVISLDGRTRHYNRSLAWVI